MHSTDKPLGISRWRSSSRGSRGRRITCRQLQYYWKLNSMFSSRLLYSNTWKWAFCLLALWRLCSICNDQVMKEHFFCTRAGAGHPGYHQTVRGPDLSPQIRTGDSGKDRSAQHWSGPKPGGGAAAVQPGAEPLWDGHWQHHVHHGFLWRYRWMLVFLFSHSNCQTVL